MLNELTSGDTMDIGAIAAVAGSSFAGLSILLAVFTFRRREDKETFSSFRLSLVDLRHGLLEFGRRIGTSEAIYTEITASITRELQALMPAGVSREDILGYFEEKRHYNFIVQAIHLGKERSKVLNDTEKMLESLERAPFVYRDSLPILSLLIRSLSFYLVHGFRGTVSPRAYLEIMGTPEAFVKFVKPTMQEYQGVESMWNDLTDTVSQWSTKLMMDHGADVITPAAEMLLLVVEHFADMSDAELRQEGRRQKKRYAQARRVDEQTAIEDAYEYCKLMKDVFPPEEWDQLVETKTKVLERAHRAKLAKQGS